MQHPFKIVLPSSISLFPSFHKGTFYLRNNLFEVTEAKLEILILGGFHLYFYKEDLINMIVPDKPDPNAAKVLQETLGGQFGEMRTMMQYSFQSANFRGNAKQYRDLIRGVFLEELSHVELVQ